MIQIGGYNIVLDHIVRWVLTRDVERRRPVLHVFLTDGDDLTAYGPEAERLDQELHGAFSGRAAGGRIPETVTITVPSIQWAACVHGSVGPCADCDADVAS